MLKCDPAADDWETKSTNIPLQHRQCLRPKLCGFVVVRQSHHQMVAATTRLKVACELEAASGDAEASPSAMNNEHSSNLDFHGICRPADGASTRGSRSHRGNTTTLLWSIVRPSRAAWRIGDQLPWCGAIAQGSEGALNHIPRDRRRVRARPSSGLMSGAPRFSTRCMGNV